MRRWAQGILAGASASALGLGLAMGCSASKLEPAWVEASPACMPVQANGSLRSICTAQGRQHGLVSLEVASDVRCVRVTDRAATRLGYYVGDDSPDRSALELDPRAGRAGLTFRIDSESSERGDAAAFVVGVGKGGAISIETFTKACWEICPELDGDQTFVFTEHGVLTLDGGAGPPSVCRAVGPKSLDLRMPDGGAGRTSSPEGGADAVNAAARPAPDSGPADDAAAEAGADARAPARTDTRGTTKPRAPGPRDAGEDATTRRR